jgi:Arc/MetJ-type ribon-helix-helix transcriptional regulator
MGTLTVKLPRPLEARLDAVVRRRKQRKSDVVREAIERLVAEDSEKGSVLDLMRDLKGIGSGPKDLATNPKYMKGYGR